MLDLVDRRHDLFNANKPDKSHVRYGPDKKIADAVGRVRYSHHAAAFLCDGDGVVDADC